MIGQEECYDLHVSIDGNSVVTVYGFRAPTGPWSSKQCFISDLSQYL